MNKRIEKYLIKNASNLKDKTIFLTGGTGEIGEYIVEYLLYLGANVVLGVRDIKKGNSLKEKYPTKNISLIQLNFNDVYSIKECVNNLKNRKIDTIIIHSGADIALDDKQKAFEMNFMINCYGPYLFMKLIGNNIPMIVTCSISYKKIKNKEIYKFKDSYAYSKRILLQLCYILKTQEDYNITLVHPGIALTNLFMKRHKNLKILLPVLRIFIMDKSSAALNIVYAIGKATKPYEWIGPGGSFEIYGHPKIRKLKKDVYNDRIIVELKTKIEEINKKMEEKYKF